MSMSNSSWTFFCPSAQRKQNKTSTVFSNSDNHGTAQVKNPAPLSSQPWQWGAHSEKNPGTSFSKHSWPNLPPSPNSRVCDSPWVARHRGVTSKGCSAVTEHHPDVWASPLLPRELTARGRGTLLYHPAGRSYPYPHIYSKTKAP